MRRSFTALFLASLTSGLMMGQDAPAYLDQFIAKVKPDKRAEFDAISKKMAALNRRNKGDTWLASENMYGEDNVVTFVSLRSGFGDVQKAFDLFMGALAKPGGMAAAEKLVGEQGTSFHITRPLGSLGDIDDSRTLQQVPGANGYKQYQKGLAETLSPRKLRSAATCRS